MPGKLRSEKFWAQLNLAEIVKFGKNCVSPGLFMFLGHLMGHILDA